MAACCDVVGRWVGRMGTQGGQGGAPWRYGYMYTKDTPGKVHPGHPGQVHQGPRPAVPRTLGQQYPGPRPAVPRPSSQNTA